MINIIVSNRNTKSGTLGLQTFDDNFVKIDISCKKSPLLLNRKVVAEIFGYSQIYKYRKG